MKQRTKRTTVRNGSLIPLGNNFAYVLGDHPNKVDDVDIGPNNKNGLSVNNGEIMQFQGNGVRVFSAEPILNGISPSRLVQAGMNPNTVFAAQEKYKDINRLKDNGDSYKSGGIHIAPSKRGTFTAAAKKHGMGVQAFASRVLANKSNYSPAMVKKANFARNVSRWHHALGGENPNEFNVENQVYASIPLQGDPLYDITGTTRYATDDSNSSDVRNIILSYLWAMENPYNKGLNEDGTYSPYGDPNGRDQNVGPGILLSNLPTKTKYTKQELEDFAYNKILDGRSKIKKSFDDAYGVGEYDKLDEVRKYILDDVRYRNGTVSKDVWPALYQAIYDNDIEKALSNARTTFKNNEGIIIGWDNGRIERLAKQFYPNIVVKHRGNTDSYLEVSKKK